MMEEDDGNALNKTNTFLPMLNNGAINNGYYYQNVTIYQNIKKVRKLFTDLTENLCLNQREDVGKCIFISLYIFNKENNHSKLSQK